MFGSRYGRKVEHIHRHSNKEHTMNIFRTLNPTSSTNTNRTTNRATGKIRTALGLAVLAGVGILAAPSSAQATGTWQYLDINYNGRNDVAAIDRNGDGALDEVWFDRNEDGWWDATGYDGDGDRTFEWFRAWNNVDGSQGWVNTTAVYLYTYFDKDGNGRFETHSYDQNRDGRAEWLMIDTNQDGHADTWTAIAAATTSVTASATAANDMMVQHIVTMNQLRIYGSRL